MALEKGREGKGRRRRRRRMRRWPRRLQTWKGIKEEKVISPQMKLGQPKIGAILIPSDLELFFPPPKTCVLAKDFFFFFQAPFYTAKNFPHAHLFDRKKDRKKNIKEEKEEEETMGWGHKKRFHFFSF